ncbi:MATE family efflux transporter [Chloroflexota bacterium]
MVVSGSLTMIGPTIDMIWVGKLGTTPMAGVGVSGMVVQLVDAIHIGLTVGVRAMVARFTGAGDAEAANHAAKQAFVVSIAFCIIIAIIGIFFAKPILILLGVGPDVANEGALYLRIMLVGSVFMSFRTLTEAIMQASGDAINPMKIAVFYRLFHVALCPCLIFGWWLFPQLGIGGAAVTNIFSQALGATLGLWLLFTGRTRLQLTLKNFRLDPNTILRMLKIGLPPSVVGLQTTFVQLLFMWFITPFGTLAIAAHSMCQRVQVFMQTVGRGVGQASGVLIGQNLGARQPERAKKSGWLAAGLVSTITVITSAIILIWPESIVRIFSTDPDLVSLGSTFLLIYVAGSLGSGLIAVFVGSLQGAGDTLVPMLVNLLNMWLLTMPLAFFLTRYTDIGVFGVRWAMVASTTVSGIFYTIYFQGGRWKLKEV